MSDFQLVSPANVAGWLTYPKKVGRWKLLEAHFSSIGHPLDGDLPNRIHIPRAIQVHPSYLEAGTNRDKYYPFYEHPTDGNLLPERELAQALERLGITPDTFVVVYGTEPKGAMAASRLIWGLIVAGVKTVRLLDGGIDAWVAFGGKTESHITASWDLDPTRPQSLAWHIRRNFLATTDEVRKISEDPHHSAAKLVDVRKPGEWDGTLTRYYPFFSKAGHIPNAHFQGDWDNLVDMETHKLRPKLDAVAQRWRQLGIIDAAVEDGETTLIFYCGTGWRSSISFLVALLLGLRAKNYDGGFYSWSWTDENEIALGKVQKRNHQPQHPAG